MDVPFINDMEHSILQRSRLVQGGILAGTINVSTDQGVVGKSIFTIICAGVRIGRSNSNCEWQGVCVG